MNTFKYLVTILAAGAIAVAARAEILPAEKLLPQDTLFVLSLPDTAKLRTSWEASPGLQLWRDPAMRAFKDKFLDRLRDEVLAPLEREIGAEVGDYWKLAQGQVTFAIVQDGWNGESGGRPAFVLLADSREKAGDLREALAGVKQRWSESGKTLRGETLRGIEFSVFLVSSRDIGKAVRNVFPLDDEPAEDVELDLYIGQVDSLLVAGTSSQVIEQLLARQGGTALPALGELAAFQSDRDALLRQADSFAWFNLRPLIEILMQREPPEDDPFAINPAMLISALGFDGLRTAAFSFRQTDEGGLAEVFVGAPEDKRAGLFRIFNAEPKASAPPGFVPAAAMKFTRWRMDLSKTLANIEAMMVGVSPAAGGALNLVLGTIGKDKDPDFDVRADVFGNLGDDVVTFQRTPRAMTAEAMSSPPSLVLISSPNSERLAGALHIALESFSGGMAEMKEREFRGRKIYSIAIGGLLPVEGAQGGGVSFASSGGYIAFSSDDAVLEEFLRSFDGGGTPLSETAGLAAAAEKVGGMNTGFFGFNNDREEFRVMLGVLKNEAGGLEDFFAASPFAAALGLGDGEGRLNDWLDFTLLPPFEAISKYFHYSVYAGAFTREGFHLKYFSPTPPEAN